jgi:hypothetical protein
MSPGEFQPGERVRVTAANRVSGYQPGDKGTVQRAVISTATGVTHYLVMMDKDDPAKSGVVFAADEVEPDI